MINLFQTFNIYLHEKEKIPQIYNLIFFFLRSSKYNASFNNFIIILNHLFITSSDAMLDKILEYSFHGIFLYLRSFKLFPFYFVRNTFNHQHKQTLISWESRKMEEKNVPEDMK